MKDQLPKAYLRIDVNLDHTHPDPGRFVRLLCAGSRQHPRGRFKSWAVLAAVVGKESAKKHRDLWKDVVQDGDAWVIDGWDIWQEGDMTVGDRMRRYRDRKRNGAVTPGVTPTVAEPSTDPPTDRNSLSEAVGSRQNGSLASLSVQSEKAVDLRKPPEEQAKYGQEIWTELLKRRGTGDLPGMSSVEFSLVAKWFQLGIPLRIVLRGIADCSPGRQLPNLKYCGPAVEEAFGMWQRAVSA